MQEKPKVWILEVKFKCKTKEEAEILRDTILRLYWTRYQGAEIKEVKHNKPRDDEI